MTLNIAKKNIYRHKVEDVFHAEKYCILELQGSHKYAADKTVRPGERQSGGGSYE
jgi:hypothetical protein